MRSKRPVKKSQKGSREVGVGLVTPPLENLAGVSNRVQLAVSESEGSKRYLERPKVSSVTAVRVSCAMMFDLDVVFMHSNTKLVGLCSACLDGVPQNKIRSQLTLNDGYLGS